MPTQMAMFRFETFLRHVCVTHLRKVLGLKRLLLQGIGLVTFDWLLYIAFLGYDCDRILTAGLSLGLLL